MSEPGILHGIVAEEYEELRVALVMNGGVSLAVWIGGVSNEVNRATRGESIYGKLLELTASVLRVDVISGTSAGGINGGLLALALAYGARLDPLRGMWLDRGAFDRLLRSPHESDPPSLLQGNEFFLPQLREAYRQVKASGSLTSSAQVPIDLTLTTTLLHGQARLVPDDLGTLITDVSHRGRFEFRRGPDLPGKDAFATDDIADRLALASRATASFPIAFEPLFCPVQVQELPQVDGLIDMHGAANFKTSRYLLDGGILDNKPLEAAIAAIFRQRADRDVRRVLCYVVPAPGDSAMQQADRIEDAPGLGQVALASLMNLPRVESISAQLETIIEHNRNVRRKRQTRVAFARDVGWQGTSKIAGQLFGVYRSRRLGSAAEYVVEEVAGGVVESSKEQALLGRRRREWLMGVLSSPPQVPWVPDQLPSWQANGEPVDLLHWNWGALTLQNISEVMLDLLRRAMHLTRPLDSETRTALRKFRVAAYDIIANIPQLRERDRDFWRSRGVALHEALSLRNDPGEMAQTATVWVNESIGLWKARTLRFDPKAGVLMFAPKLQLLRATNGEVSAQTVLGWLAHSIAALIFTSAPLLRAVQRRAVEASRRTSQRTSAGEFESLLSFFVPEGVDGPQQVLSRLLTMDVALYAIGAQENIRDQFIELVQLSADVASPLGGAAKAASKLAGAQIANFSGFYRKSWRANDWLFGRLDSAERLVRMLLDPGRILRIYSDRTPAEALSTALEQIAVPQPGDADAIDREFLKDQWQRRRAAVVGELAFMDHPEYPVPEQLGSAIHLAVMRVQLSILREELSIIAGAVEDDQANGAALTGHSADFLREVKRRVPPQQLHRIAMLPTGHVLDLFHALHIGEERIDAEVGTDLFTKTVTRTLAVGATALSSKGSGLGGLRHVMQTLRLPTLAVDALAQSLVRRSRTGMGFFVAALTASAVLVALQLFAAPLKVPSSIIVAAAVVFVAAIALLLRRSARLVMLWLLAAGIATIVHVGTSNALSNAWTWIKKAFDG